MENTETSVASTATHTWQEFLELFCSSGMRQPSSTEFVKSIKNFIASLLNNAPDAERDSASIQQFLSNMDIAFKHHPLNKSRLVGEASYVFTNMLSAEALSFILNIDAKALSMDEIEFVKNMEFAHILISGLYGDYIDGENMQSKEPQISGELGDVGTIEGSGKGFGRETEAPPSETQTGDGTAKMLEGNIGMKLDDDVVVPVFGVTLGVSSETQIGVETVDSPERDAQLDVGVEGGRNDGVGASTPESVVGEVVSLLEENVEK
ncbi:hypothetical protein Tco_1266630 [Tanacetum coccineum]